MTDFLDPWYAIDADRGHALVRQFVSELGPNHELFGLSAVAIAKRDDCDEVLYLLEGHTWAVVHLTWGQSIDSRWPRFELYGSESDFVRERMANDHVDWRYGEGLEAE